MYGIEICNWLLKFLESELLSNKKFVYIQYVLELWAIL